MLVMVIKSVAVVVVVVVVVVVYVGAEASKFTTSDFRHQPSSQHPDHTSCKILTRFEIHVSIDFVIVS